MHVQKDSKSSEWLPHAKEASAAIHSKFIARDAEGSPIVLEWKKTDIQSPDLAEFKKNICDLACQILAPIEVQFLQTYPNAVSEELFLKPCAPLFEKGPAAVDWKEVETTIQSTIKQFYLTDLSSFGTAVIKPLLEDVYFLVMIKESSDLLGFAMFAITPALPFGNVKLINIACRPEKKDRGLDQLLVSSIFKIIPQTERVFLFIRPTHDTAFKKYCHWGFTPDQNPVQDPNHQVNMEYLTLLEYRANQSTTLQKTANTLIEEPQSTL